MSLRPAKRWTSYSPMNPGNQATNGTMNGSISGIFPTYIRSTSMIMHSLGTRARIARALVELGLDRFQNIRFLRHFGPARRNPEQTRATGNRRRLIAADIPNRIGHMGDVWVMVSRGLGWPGPINNSRLLLSHSRAFLPPMSPPICGSLVLACGVGPFHRSLRICRRCQGCLVLVCNVSDMFFLPVCSWYISCSCLCVLLYFGCMLLDGSVGAFFFVSVSAWFL